MYVFPSIFPPVMYVIGRNTEDWGASEEIFAAASDGNVARLEELVSKGAKVDAQVGTVTSS